MKIPSQHDTKTSPLGEMATSKIMPENRSSAIRRKLYFAPGFKQFAAHGVGEGEGRLWRLCGRGFKVASSTAVSSVRSIQSFPAATIERKY